MGRVFGGPKKPNGFLHHNPSEGGEKEVNKHTDYYSRTLDFYRKVFEAEPPEEIWLSVE